MRFDEESNQQLPISLHQPHPSPVSDLPVPAPTTSFLICQLTTLTIHNSLTLSLQAQNLPLSHTFLTIDFLQASGLTSQTLWLDHFFWASWFFLFFITLFFVFMRQIKLAIRQLLGACKYSLLYCVICRQDCHWYTDKHFNGYCPHEP